MSRSNDNDPSKAYARLLRNADSDARADGDSAAQPQSKDRRQRDPRRPRSPDCPAIPAAGERGANTKACDRVRLGYADIVIAARWLPRRRRDVAAHILRKFAGLSDDEHQEESSRHYFATKGVVMAFAGSIEIGRGVGVDESDVRKDLRELEGAGMISRGGADRDGNAKATLFNHSWFVAAAKDIRQGRGKSPRPKTSGGGAFQGAKAGRFGPQGRGDAPHESLDSESTVESTRGDARHTAASFRRPEQLVMTRVLAYPRHAQHPAAVSRGKRKPQHEMTSQNVAKYARRAGHFWAWFLRQTSRAPTNEDAFEPWLIKFATEERARGVVHGTVSVTLNVTISALEERGARINRQDPTLAPLLKQRSEKRSYVLHPEEDLRALVVACDEELFGWVSRFVILASAWLEARPAEIRLLRLDQFSSDERGASIAGRRVPRIGGELCLVTLTERLILALGERGVSNGPIARSRKYRRSTLAAVGSDLTLWRYVKEAAARAGVASVTSASLRHSGRQLFAAQPELTVAG